MNKTKKVNKTWPSLGKIVRQFQVDWLMPIQVALFKQKSLKVVYCFTSLALHFCLFVIFWVVLLSSALPGSTKSMKTTMTNFFVLPWLLLLSSSDRGSFFQYNNINLLCNYFFFLLISKKEEDFDD